MFEQAAQVIAPIILRVLGDEYEQQGHKLSGNLRSSLGTNIRADAVSAVVEVLMLEYGRYISDGVPASRIPYSPNSGAKTSKYITGLTEFAKQRFAVGQKEATRIAFAIARKQKEQGMPTKGSFRYSKNGRRTGAIEAAFADAVPEMQTALQPVIADAVFNLIKPKP